MLVGEKENVDRVVNLSNEILTSRHEKYLDEILPKLGRRLVRINEWKEENEKFLSEVEYSFSMCIDTDNAANDIAAKTSIESEAHNHVYDLAERELQVCNQIRTLQRKREEWEIKLEESKQQPIDVEKLTEIVIPGLFGKNSQGLNTPNFQESSCTRYMFAGIQQPNVKAKTYGRSGYHQGTLDWHVGSAEGSETPYQTAQRELWEEAGIWLNIDDIENYIIRKRDNVFMICIDEVVDQIVTSTNDHVVALRVEPHPEVSREENDQQLRTGPRTQQPPRYRQMRTGPRTQQPPRYRQMRTGPRTQQPPRYRQMRTGPRTQQPPRYRQMRTGPRTQQVMGGRSNVVCRYGNNCRYGDNCRYYHP